LLRKCFIVCVSLFGFSSPQLTRYGITILDKNDHLKVYLVGGALRDEFLSQPVTEEYALARLERKISAGHQGFTFDTAATVTLEEDLLRRDLTINAIARSKDGTIIDPYGGLTDIESRVLRHVSPAFAEDPLRVLRVARFAAKLQPLGFSIAPETMQLMTEITQSGELTTLSVERLWSEFQRSLAYPTLP